MKTADVIGPVDAIVATISIVPEHMMCISVPILFPTQKYYS